MRFYNDFQASSWPLVSFGMSFCMIKVHPFYISSTGNSRWGRVKKGVTELHNLLRLCHGSVESCRSVCLFDRGRGWAAHIADMSVHRMKHALWLHSHRFSKCSAFPQRSFWSCRCFDLCVRKLLLWRVIKIRFYPFNLRFYLHPLTLSLSWPQLLSFSLFFWRRGKPLDGVFCKQQLTNPACFYIYNPYILYVIQP